jgi:hypothetical protein
LRRHREPLAFAAGVTLGTDLKDGRAIERRAFPDWGFGTDLSGGLYSWSGGLLARQDVGGCRMGFRFVPPDVDKRPQLQALLRQVADGGTYSTGHPAMQGLNPGSAKRSSRTSARE